MGGTLDVGAYICAVRRFTREFLRTYVPWMGHIHTYIDEGGSATTCDKPNLNLLHTYAQTDKYKRSEACTTTTTGSFI